MRVFVGFWGFSGFRVFGLLGFGALGLPPDCACSKGWAVLREAAMWRTALEIVPAGDKSTHGNCKFPDLSGSSRAARPTANHEQD